MGVFDDSLLGPSFATAAILKGPALQREADNARRETQDARWMMR